MGIRRGGFRKRLQQTHVPNSAGLWPFQERCHFFPKWIAWRFRELPSRLDWLAGGASHCNHVCDRLMNLTCVEGSTQILSLVRRRRGATLEREVMMLNAAFDPVAVVVDWLDLCRAHCLDGLLNLHDARASLQCACDGPYIYQGHEDLARYWSPRLQKAVPHAFSLIELFPDNTDDSPGVVLDYIGYDGKPVRIRFRFTKDGKIARTVCAPLHHSSKAA
jgi:hypothetical protein